MSEAVRSWWPAEVEAKVYACARCGPVPVDETATAREDEDVTIHDGTVPLRVANSIGKPELAGDYCGQEVIRLAVVPAPRSGPKPELSDRGFAQFEPTETDYRAVVRFYESSSANSPHLWMEAMQPAPRNPGDLPAAKVNANMSLDQAREIHRKLGEAIEYVAERWDA